MSSIAYFIGKGFLIGCADEILVNKKERTVTDTLLKIKQMKGPYILAYAGSVDYGSKVLSRVLDHQGKYTLTEALQAIENAYKNLQPRRGGKKGKGRGKRGQEVSFMLGGYDPEKRDFSIVVSDGTGSRRSPITNYCSIGWGGKIAQEVMDDYVRHCSYARDLEQHKVARVLLDAIDQSRRAIIGEGTSIGKSQLIIVDSKGSKKDFSREKTTLLTRLVRELRRQNMAREEGDFLLTGQEIDNVYRDIIETDVDISKVLRGIDLTKREHLFKVFMTDLTL